MTIEEERESIAFLINSLSDRVVELHGAIEEMTKKRESHEDEHAWVRLAIQREAQSIEFRKAIIEKSLAGLLWAFIAGIGYLALDWLKVHGFKA